MEQLVTIGPLEQLRLAYRQRSHPYLASGTLSGGIVPDVPVSPAPDKELLPLVTNWVEVGLAFDLRSAQISGTVSEISLTRAASDRFRALFGQEAQVNLGVVVSLVNEGGAVIDIARGRVEPPIALDPLTETYTLRVSTEPVPQGVTYPAESGKLTRELFPEMPEWADGLFSRRTIIGRLEFEVVCPPIAPNRAYVAEPPLSDVSDIRVTVDGQPAERFTVVAATIPGTQLAYTELSFAEDVFQDRATVVTLSGGAGIDPSRHPLAVLADFARTPLSSRAASLLDVLRDEFSRYAFNFLTNANAEVMALIRDRLLPQTGLLLLPDGVFLDLTLVPTRTLAPIAVLREGDTIRAILDTDRGEGEPAFNQVTIGLGRDPEAMTDEATTRLLVTLGADSVSDPRLAKFVHAHVQRFGPRELRIDMPDVLATTRDLPAFARRLAHFLLANAALSGRRVTVLTDHMPRLLPGIDSFLLDLPSLAIESQEFALRSVTHVANGSRLVLEGVAW